MLERASLDGDGELNEDRPESCQDSSEVAPLSSRTIESLSAEKRRKGYVDDILRSLLFVGFMMENYSEARPIDTENMMRHCRKMGTRWRIFAPCVAPNSVR